MYEGHYGNDTSSSATLGPNTVSGQDTKSDWSFQAPGESIVYVSFG